jgi:hypothetical protein
MPKFVLPKFKSLIMRTLITAICLLLIVVVSNGQSETTRIFKPFRVDLSTGYALPLGGGAANNVGWLGSIEPKYGITDKLGLGLRMELSWLDRTSPAGSGTDVGTSQGNYSFTFTGDYYFNTNKFRPFIGGGPGFDILGGAAVSHSKKTDVTTWYDNETKFCYMLRAGFEVGLFRFGVEYNGIASTNSSPYNNYIGFKVSGLVGGNRIKK